MQAMKLTDLDLSEVEKYILDPEWVMQQKHDGARMVAEFNAHDGLRFLAQNGEPMKFAAAALAFDALGKHLLADIESLDITDLILDGEILPETGIYHVWDVLLLQLTPGSTHALEQGNPTVIYGNEDWSWRDAVLRSQLSALEGSLVQFTATARTVSEKRQMWELINAANVEGAVSKHIHSTWNGSGLRSKEWVKHKLVKTADVVVTAVQRTFKADGVTLSHGKAELAVPIRLNDDPQPWVNAKGKRLSIVEHLKLPAKAQASFGWVQRGLLPVGNASLIGKELTIDVGSVVEVAYLNFQDAMIQPRIIRQRFDKPAEDCDLTQFPAYTRTVVTI